MACEKPSGTQGGIPESGREGCILGSILKGTIHLTCDKEILIDLVSDQGNAQHLH
jgi:hypothetical protein